MQSAPRTRRRRRAVFDAAARRCVEGARGAGAEGAGAPGAAAPELQRPAEGVGGRCALRVMGAFLSFPINSVERGMLISGAFAEAFPWTRGFSGTRSAVGGEGASARAPKIRLSDCLSSNY